MQFNKIEKYGIGINYNKYDAEVLMPLRKQQTELKDKIHSIIGYRNLDNPSQILRGLNIRGYDINSATLDEFKQRRGSDEIFNLLFQYKVNIHGVQYIKGLRIKQQDNLCQIIKEAV